MHNYYVGRDSASGRDTVADNGPDFDPGITIPNGGWNAPLTDLAKYLAFLANTTRGDTAVANLYNVVLPHRDFEEMWRPRFPTNSEGTAHGSAEEWMGMSFFIVRRGTATFVGHTGSQAGFTSFIYINPANGNAVVAAFNTLNTIPQASGVLQSRGSAFRVIREAALQMIK